MNLRLNFIHPGVRYRLLKLLCQLFGYSNNGFEVEFYGYTYKGNLKNQIDFMVFFYGAYEIGILTFLRKFLHKEAVALDVGANIGHHSLFFSAHAKQVHSFEPYAKVRNALDEKIQQNKIKNITVHPIGLSDQDQWLEYYEPPDSNLGVGSFNNTRAQLSMTHSLKCQLRNGDNFLRELAIEKVHLIKIDVEGFEKQVLVGLKETIKQHRPLVLLEFNREMQDSTPEGEFKKLFPDDYSFYALAQQFKRNVKLKPFEYHREHSINVLCSPLNLTKTE